MKLNKEIHEDLVIQKSLCICHVPSNHVLTYFSWVSKDDEFDSKRRLAWGIVFQEETEKACDLIKNLWMFSKMKIEDSGLQKIQVYRRPLIPRAMSQDPQWMSETTDCTGPCIYYISSYVHIPEINFNL